MNNYFENEYYKIQIYENFYQDVFKLDIKNNQIHIQRIDKNEGWGQNLKIKIIYKDFFNYDILTIGNSLFNPITYPLPKIINSSNHFFENDQIKLYSISPQFDDYFKVHWENNTIFVQRIDDKKNGWGQNLKIVFENKVEKNKKNIIEVGSSHKNILEFPFYLNSDSLENDDYSFHIYKNIYNDKFDIKMIDNSNITIKRIDKNEGWGQNLIVHCCNKKTKEEYDIYIGSSSTNLIKKNIMLRQNHKVYLSFTTIPSRLKEPIFWKHLESLLNDQTYSYEKLFISVAKKYKRFTETIPQNIIDKIKSYEKVILIYLEEDYGPATKYLAPMMNYRDMIEDNLLIIIDDDRYYNPNLVRNFVMGFDLYPDIRFSTGNWVDYFDKNYKNYSDDIIQYSIYQERNIPNFFFGNGLGGFYGFCMRMTSSLFDLIEYHFKIYEKVPKSFFHDEGITLGYLKFNEEKLLILKHRGCNYIKEEMVDALCFSGLCDRGKVEKEILYITNKEQLLKKIIYPIPEPYIL